MKRMRVDIMLPVYHGNLAEIPGSVKKQVDFFEEALKDYDWRIVLAINGRNADEVIRLAKNLGKNDRRIGFSYVEQSGKGSGIIHAWSMSNADIISYMDIDLSTDIRSFPDLIAQIRAGYDISIGSRYHPESKVTRSWKRKLISFAYHKIFMKIILGAKSYTDGQCGFKAVSRRVVSEILPLIRNRNWFFESEMLYIAERKGFRIKEVPVIWVESEFSGMSLYRAIFEFIRCGLGLRFRKII
jgi:glycosyltransferase involved in cell wall biosynthesis